MTSLTDRWSAWVAKHQGEDPDEPDVLHLNPFLQTLYEDLKKQGFKIPQKNLVEEHLTSGIEGLPAAPHPKSRGNNLVITWLHFLNMMWQPVMLYIESLFKDPACTMDPQVKMNETALSLEMQGIVNSPEDHMPLDDWVELIQKYLLKYLDVLVPVAHIMQVVSCVAPLCLEPTPANAMHLLRSSVCRKLVGSSMAAEVNKKVLSEIAELPVPVSSERDMLLQLKKEVIDKLTQEHGDPEDIEEMADPAIIKKKSRTLESRDALLVDKTNQVLFLLQNRVAVSRTEETLYSAVELMKSLNCAHVDSKTLQDLEQRVVNTSTMMKHVLMLDGALDRYLTEMQFQRRDGGTFAGVSLATDESPPKESRFGGLRFQISVFYLGTFVPEVEWENMVDPPIRSTSLLADIMHCPGKKGKDVSRVMEKQWARVGLNVYDVNSGTGDGGGENEGHQGIHAHFENLNPAYVRRRCLPHISWRTCDMAIKASGLDYRSLAAYLVEGVTWSRLREIATKAPADGGLQLFRDGSRECKNLFGKAPCSIVTTRPETDMEFLLFLKNKEHLLHRLATKDLEQRALSKETKEAVLNLGDMKLRIQRMILGEILHRGLFLHHWVGKNKMVASRVSWDTLMERGSCFILNLEITAEVLERFGCSEEQLRAMEPEPKTWVELVLQNLLEDRDLVEERMKEALDFHRSVSDQAAAHLSLVANNTFRTPWLAAKLLSSDAHLAHESALELLKHIVETRPSNRTQFEQHLIDSPELWHTLETFSKADPPVLLWHGQGRYSNLFKFLASAFLCAPDHVLDAERVHARWQWILGLKHNMKLHSLNALLRLMHFQENNWSFPALQELVPHLQAEQEQHRLDMQALERDGDVALGWRCNGDRNTCSDV